MTDSASHPAPTSAHPIHRLAATPSTNTVGLDLALAGAAGPLWIVADAQTAGRGRAGRTWASVPGNLYASLLVTLPAPVPGLAQLALVAGIATVDALRAVAGPSGLPGIRLKWPNDVLIGPAKVCGILVESTSLPGRDRIAAVIGIGINVAGVPEGLGRAATSLAAEGLATDRDAVHAALSESLDHWLGVWDCSRGFVRVREAVMVRAGPIGEPISVNAGNGAVAGLFAGLDHDGALLIADPAGAVHRFTFGDVTLQPLRAANPTCP